VLLPFEYRHSGPVFHHQKMDFLGIIPVTCTWSYLALQACDVVVVVIYMSLVFVCCHWSSGPCRCTEHRKIIRSPLTLLLSSLLFCFVLFCFVLFCFVLFCCINKKLVVLIGKQIKQNKINKQEHVGKSPQRFW
jgi:hypothetical protein